MTLPLEHHIDHTLFGCIVIELTWILWDKTQNLSLIKHNKNKILILPDIHRLIKLTRTTKINKYPKKTQKMQITRKKIVAQSLLVSLSSLVCIHRFQYPINQSIWIELLKLLFTAGGLITLWFVYIFITKSLYDVPKSEKVIDVIIPLSCNFLSILSHDSCQHFY